MAFRIRRDAKDWFKHIDSKAKGFSVDFDILYFCFIAGITAKRKAEAKLSDTNELVDYFPDKYAHRSKLILALFLKNELSALGISMTEKKDKAAVHSEIARLIDPEAQSHLSEDGMREFNKYVYGGFDVLLDRFDDRPRTLHSFLRGFKQVVDANVEV